MHRLAVSLKGDAGTPIPWTWRDQAQGWLYGGLLRGKEVGHSRYSYLTYSLQPGEFIASRKGLMSASGEWVLRIASAVPGLIAHLEDVLRGMKDAPVPGLPVCVGDIAREPLCDKIAFWAEPIVAIARDRSHFLVPGDGEFEKAVESALAARYRAFLGEDVPGPISFAFAGRPRQVLARYRGRKLVGFKGWVELRGPREVRLFAQMVGLGHKPSCGFGMVM